MSSLELERAGSLMKAPVLEAFKALGLYLGFNP